MILGQFGPQLRAPDLSGHGGTSTSSSGCQIECHKKCRMECQYICQIELCENMCQIEYQFVRNFGFPHLCWFPRRYIASAVVGDLGPDRRRKGLLCVLHRQNSKACERQKIMETFGKPGQRTVSIYYMLEFMFQYMFHFFCEYMFSDCFNLCFNMF